MLHYGDQKQRKNLQPGTKIRIGIKEQTLRKETSFEPLTGKDRLQGYGWLLRGRQQWWCKVLEEVN